MKESEDKKWVIGRMDAFISVNISDIESREQKTSQIFDKITKGIEKGRNIVMAIIGAIVSITFGLAAVGTISSPVTEWILAIDIGIGAFLFFVMNRFNAMVSKVLQPISTSQWRAKDEMNRFRLRVIDETVELDDMSYDKLKVYYEYITIITAGVPSVILLETLEKSKKSATYIKPFIKIFDDLIMTYMMALYAARKLYEMNKKQLEKNGFHEGLYLEMMQPLIDYFEKNPVSEPENS